MAKQIALNGLQELKTYLSSISSAKKYFILFTGSQDEKTGQSWCPDCVVADPVIHQNLKYLDEHSEFLTCYVGNKETYDFSKIYSHFLILEMFFFQR